MLSLLVYKALWKGADNLPLALTMCIRLVQEKKAPPYYHSVIETFRTLFIAVQTSAPPQKEYQDFIEKSMIVLQRFSAK